MDYMKNYLSFGGGVNSVALYLLMKKMGVEFEAVFVNHGGDWPETYEYVNYFVSMGNPITILRPEVRTIEKKVFTNIVAYHEFKNVLPSKNPKRRWCTSRFKSRVLDAYQQTPCFVFIGYASDEATRATISSSGGREYRWPLIEEGIDRQGCVEIIKSAGLEVPRKSGCYMCPYQGDKEYIELRQKHPELFCRVRRIEEAQNKRVTKNGDQWKPYYLASVPLGELVNDRQRALPGLEKIEYPPCHCGL